MALDDPRQKSFLAWRKAALFGVAYFFCAGASSFLSARNSPFVTFWLPAGLFLAVLLSNPTRDWPWLALAVLPANVAYDLLYGTKFEVILFFYCANTVQAVTGAWLVRKFVAERPTLATLKEFFGLVFFAAIFSPMLGACIGAATLVHFDLSQSFEHSWKTWWGSNAMVVLVLTPFLLTWSSKSNRTRNYFDQPNKIAEAALLFLGLISFAWYLLASDKGVMSPNKSVLIPLLLWAGLRFGVRGAAAVSLFLSLLLAFFTAQFFFGLTPSQISSGEYVFVMQMAMAMASLMALIPAIVVGERERTLAELRESEERFKNLSAAAFEGIFISENGRILDANDQGLKMFGYERAEMIGRQIIEMVAPESRGLVAEAIRTGRETIYGHQLVRKDGSIFFAEAQAKMVHVGNRTVRMTALRDVTERKHAEEALRDSEQRFRSYFELAMIGCAISSLEKGIMAVNDQFCRLLGYSREELQKMTWTQLTHPDDVIADLSQFNRVLAGEIDSYTMDKRYLRKDGREVFVTLSVRCVRHPDGSPDYFVGLVMDITDRKQVEQALRESEEKFSKAFQASPDGICITELESGRFMEVNEGYCRLFNYTREELIGRSATEMGIFEDTEARSPFVQALRDTGSVRDMELTTYGRGRRKILVHVSAECIELGTHPCIVSVIHDVTDRKRTEAERDESIAREAQARADYTFQLIASQEAERMRIARELHDGLSQNLLLIKNRAQLQMAGAKLPEEVHEELQGISNIASQAIAEVRQIARDLHPHQLDLLGLTRALRALIENADESSAIDISGKFDSADDLFPREAATNIYRIVQESLNNILKHSHAKTARITLERDVHEVQLRIDDDGCGFKAGRNGSGKGLGLKNIAERVRMLGGKLKLDSQPGNGTRIEITIPISAEHG
jgi:PAS domain S-box-containing protein